jgi:competence protein ComEC
MGGRCAVACAVAVWMGMLAGRGSGVVGAVVCLIAAAPFAWLAVRAPARVGTVAVLVALALAAAARGGLSRAALDHGPAALGDDAPARWITGRVVEHPLREGGEPLAIVTLTRVSPPLPAGTRVRLRLPPACDAEIGDEVTALARIERPPARRNPGGLSSREIAATSGVAVQGHALAADVRPATGIAATARATVTRWRRAIERGYARRLDDDAREIVTPLVIGDRSALPPSLGAHLRVAGLTHLLALSGLHVVWLAGLARGGAAAVGRGVRGRALAGAACALFYMGIAGPLPSLMRAVATESLVAVARLLGRALDPVQALAMSVVALLALAPGWADDLGFQLSCVATLGLVTIGPWLTERSGRLRRVAAPFVPTVAAQLTALPLLIDRFHALPWLSLLTNLFAVPVCGLLLAAAWLAAVLEAVLPGAGAAWFGACNVLAAALRLIADLTARVPGALIATGSEPATPWLAALGATLLVLALPRGRALEHAMRPSSHRRGIAALLGATAMLASLGLAMTAPPLAPPPGRWWMIALDVGQGDAIALAFADGWWLVDTGVRTPHVDAGEMMVLPFLRWAGVRSLRQVALTHDDGDHTGGAWAVLHGASVGALVVPTPVAGVPGPGARFRGAGVPIRPVSRGDTLHRSPRIIVRWPPAGAALPFDNAAALVLEVGEGRARALLTADLDSLREDSLDVVAGPAVLKVGHHGSGSSSGARFLRRLRPALAVISVGHHNAFGHPDARALQRLREAGARVVRTDAAGAVWLEFDADSARMLDWRRARPDIAATRDGPGRARLPGHEPGW